MPAFGLASSSAITASIELGEISSPIGDVRIAVAGGRLCALAFADRWQRAGASLERRFGHVDLASGRATAPVLSRLRDYFVGDLAALDAIDVDVAGTSFQLAVWTALRRVPAGTTTTYTALARAIGAPAAVRAVGMANGANPVLLVVPCHRAIGSDGSLTGYGGGLERKRWLLEHERAQLAPGASLLA